MLSFRYRIVELTGPDGTSQWTIHAVGHDDTGQPVKLAGQALAVACDDDGASPADSLRQQMQTILAALDEPIVTASSLAPADDSDWPTGTV
jgi:hypothetical protein